MVVAPKLDKDGDLQFIRDCQPFKDGDRQFISGCQPNQKLGYAVEKCLLFESETGTCYFESKSGICSWNGLSTGSRTRTCSFEVTLNRLKDSEFLSPGSNTGTCCIKRILIESETGTCSFELAANRIKDTILQFRSVCQPNQG